MTSRREASRHATYSVTSWLFLRILGLVYLFAFWSLHQQILGLIGADGILPVGQYLQDVRGWAVDNGIGAGRYRLLPTVFWFASSDGFLQGVTVAGIALAVMLIAGVAPAIALPLLWFGYLSLVVAARDFLSFQWDALLLETGLLAMLVSPMRWRHRLAERIDPPPIARGLVWWLMVRLMFGSGLVKLASGDPSWNSLQALLVHYETQPLPTPLAWYVSQLPAWWHRASTGVVLAIELVVPWFVCFGIRPRRLAAGVLITLQLLIALTGNYAFFNLLSIGLCLTLLDDGAVARWLGRARPSSQPRPGRVPRWLPATGAVLLGLMSLAVFAQQVGRPVPPPLDRVVDFVRPFASVNTYGLFAVMTTTRPEIVVEGSMDGVTWRPYEFTHKPGNLARRPTWVAPFQPRLDWQMWFAALGRYEEEAWFQRFCLKLLEGSTSVTGLLADNPFPGTPPRLVRSTLYRYRFAPPGGRQWWTRERIGEYSPPMSRDGVHRSN